MTLSLRCGIAGAATAIVLCSGACGRDTPKAPPPTTESPADAPPTKRVVGPLSEADAAALATMNDKIKDYVAFHSKIEQALPALPKDATPIQIDKNQRLFEDNVRKSRATAKRGDIFTAEATPVIMRLIAAEFGGPDGAQLKASIMDENPAGMKLAVNMRYPDVVPISTVPPPILQTLPKLTEDLEYRFVGDNLILLDSHAHVIADFIENVFPK
jgi:hypothetical protein